MKASSTVLCAGLAGILLVSGCASVNRTTKGAVIGGAAGAAVGGLWGAARGNAAEGALIGAGVGALAGGVTGHILDKQAKELEDAGIKAEKQKDNTLLVTMSGDTLRFDTGKSSLKPEGKDQLDKLVKVLKKYPQNRILIGGHTDNTGRKATNQVLSEQRANAVKEYSLFKGLPSGSVLAVSGYGDSQPIATNATSAGRTENRRVELKISIAEEEGSK